MREENAEEITAFIKILNCQFLDFLDAKNLDPQKKVSAFFTCSLSFMEIFLDIAPSKLEIEKAAYLYFDAFLGIVANICERKGWFKDE